MLCKYPYVLLFPDTYNPNQTTVLLPPLERTDVEIRQESKERMKERKVNSCYRAVVGRSKLCWSRCSVKIHNWLRMKQLLHKKDLKT